ncbi:MAG: hypothetical protein HY909_28255 [Deltaproteobacteria bacterium]|nr:hypothetical protein [Deltaproteobacteria bacterium]
MAEDREDAVLPPCGLYRTTTRLGQLPAGRLVYFHNHGEPAPGVYVPESWTQNRVNFSREGIPIPGAWWASTLDPVAPEGFYRVREEFHCCEKRCRTFVVDQLVQLAYTAEAEPLVFLPEIIDNQFVLPEEGNKIDRARVRCLAPLKLPTSSSSSQDHTP